MPARPRSASPTPSYAERPWLSSYPPHVPAEIDVPDVPLTRFLDDAARRHPQARAISFLGTAITYRGLRAEVDALAAGLAGLGVRRGDRVALVLPNCPQNVLAFHATLRLGGIVVECNPLSVEEELTRQLANCGAEVVVCLDRVYETLAAIRASGGTAVREIVVTSIVDYLPPSSRLRLRLPLASARKARAQVEVPLPPDARVHRLGVVVRAGRSRPAARSPLQDGSEVAILQYTTGTTGSSKGAMLTHRNLVANAHQCLAWYPEPRPGKETVLCVLPLFHVYGITLCMTSGMAVAANLVLLPRFDQDMVFDAIARYRPTLFPGVPPIYQALLDNPKIRSYDLRSIRACVSGAMKLPDDVRERFERVTGGRLVEGYGMTETSPVTHAGPLSGPSSGPRKPGIGLPVPSTWARIVDRDDPTVEVPVGEPGELAVRGPQVFAGYWNRPYETAGVMSEGWLLTGDIARMDADGWFEIVDRKKEIIIAGGFNVYPNEVEEVLRGLPQVREVCVVGVPDRYRGETVKAFVVSKPGASLTAEDVVAHAAEHLTPYKVPKLVEFRDELPKVGVGKVLRRALREEERAKAGGAAR
ncbi:MAG TPA: AMP-binding protein [Frankiaceae bacterium]|nr:AMP-binding protein [Frankiaceae bacterium]